jgi:HAD superfamily hydrolase (TIGR01490 family)
VSALRAHRAAGDAVVLVSGSFLPCLAPVADDLGVTRVLCTQVTVAPLGTLTGAVEAPMIGRAKADAVRATIAGLGLSAAACWAYGDHASDLEMLRAVGHPSVVGDDPVLIGQAREHGWPVLERADYERGRT